MYRYCKENIDLGILGLKRLRNVSPVLLARRRRSCRAVEKFQGRSHVCMRVSLARSIKTNQIK